MKNILSFNFEGNFSKIRFFIILFLIIIGVALCFDLTYIFYKTNFLEAANPSFCSINELIDCDGVAKTPYSLSMGVPNSIWGLILYSTILMLLFVDRIQAKFPNSIFNVFKNPHSYIAFLGLLSFSISMILAFISLKVIHKICYLCFLTYFVDLFIALCAMSPLKEGSFIQDIKTTIKDFYAGAREHFILFLIVAITFTSTLIYLDRSLLLSPKLKKERELKEFMKADSNKYAIKGNTLGNKNAKVKINVYSDFNCPFCKVVNIMVHKAAKTGKIIVEEVNYPLDKSCNTRIGGTLGGHENSCMYAAYALAAKKQGKYWGVADILFYKNPKTQDELIEYIRKNHLGINIKQFLSDANSPEIMEIIQQDIQKSMDKGITGTPALEINGVMYIGAMPYNDLMEKINLAQKRLENDK